MSDSTNDDEVELSENIPVIDYAPAKADAAILPGIFGWIGYALMWIYLLYLLAAESWRLSWLISYVQRFLTIRTQFVPYRISSLISVVFIIAYVFMLWPMAFRKRKATKYFASLLICRFLLYLIVFLWFFVGNCITHGLATTLRLYKNIIEVSVLVHPVLLFIVSLIVLKSKRINSVFVG